MLSCIFITELYPCISELKEEAERYQAQYRTEKQKRKELELRVNNMEEELQDLKTDKETLERVSGVSVLLEECSQWNVIGHRTLLVQMCIVSMYVSAVCH